MSQTEQTFQFPVDYPTVSGEPGQKYKPMTLQEIQAMYSRILDEPAEEATRQFALECARRKFELQHKPMTLQEIQAMYSRILDEPAEEATRQFAFECARRKFGIQE